MTRDDARIILEVEKDADLVSVKRQYHRLMLRFHPDAAASGEGDHKRAQEIIEAYRTIIGQNGDEPEQDSWWDAPIVASAPADRTVYVRYRFFDHEDLPASEVARGKFIWDPEMEEFSLFCRSILELSRSYADDADISAIKDRFHMLMQAYINPEYCIPRLNAPAYTDETGVTWYGFRGHVLIEDREKADLTETGMPVEFSFTGDRAYASIRTPAGETAEIGALSFDEDHLYYVLLPMIRDGKTKVRARILDVKKPVRKSRQGCKCLLQLEMENPT